MALGGKLHGREVRIVKGIAVSSHAHIAMWISDGINSHDNRNEHAIALCQPAHPGLAAGLRAGALLL